MFNSRNSNNRDTFEKWFTDIYQIYKNTKREDTSAKDEYLSSIISEIQGIQLKALNEFRDLSKEKLKALKKDLEDLEKNLSVSRTQDAGNKQLRELVDKQVELKMLKASAKTLKYFFKRRIREQQLTQVTNSYSNSNKSKTSLSNTNTQIIQNQNSEAKTISKNKSDFKYIRNTLIVGGLVLLNVGAAMATLLTGGAAAPFLILTLGLASGYAISTLVKKEKQTSSGDNNVTTSENSFSEVTSFNSKEITKELRKKSFNNAPHSSQSDLPLGNFTSNKSASSSSGFESNLVDSYVPVQDDKVEEITVQDDKVEETANFILSNKDFFLKFCDEFLNPIPNNRSSFSLYINHGNSYNYLIETLTPKILNESIIEKERQKQKDKQISDLKSNIIKINEFVNETNKSELNEFIKVNSRFVDYLSTNKNIVTGWTSQNSPQVVKEKSPNNSSKRFSS